MLKITSMTFLPKTLNSSLTMRVTSDKSQFRNPPRIYINLFKTETFVIKSKGILKNSHRHYLRHSKKKKKYNCGMLDKILEQKKNTRYKVRISE